jgi:hypothetical protein
MLQNGRCPGMLAHFGIPGPAPFLAVGLFFSGVGAALGAYRFSRHSDPRVRQIGTIGLGAVSLTCFLIVTFFPLLLGGRPSLGRPSTTAELTMVSPRPGERFHGDPAIVPVDLHLVGGRVVQTTSLRLVRNEGHIHLYLDGSLVAMTGLTGAVRARPGTHTLRAEFVAIDHLPFNPRVSVTVEFTVDP